MFFTKCLVAAWLFVMFDDRWTELSMCYILTSICTLVTIKAIQRVIADRERLKECNPFDLYVVIFLDIIYQWDGIVGKKLPAIKVKDEKED